MTVARVKEKLMTHVGSNVSTMRLSLKDWEWLVAPMSDDAKMLGYFSPEDGWTIHIDDTDAHSASAGGWLEDVSKVKKYEMSDDAYNARENTYRQWKNEQLAKDPTWCLEKAMAEKRGETRVPKRTIEDDEHQAEEAAAIVDQVGNRCEVNPGGKRGVVKFVGKVEGLPKGWWVGVAFDEPVGKNDGAVRSASSSARMGTGRSSARERQSGGLPEEDDPFAESGRNLGDTSRRLRTCTGSTLHTRVLPADVLVERPPDRREPVSLARPRFPATSRGFSVEVARHVHGDAPRDAAPGQERAARRLQRRSR